MIPPVRQAYSLFQGAVRIGATLCFLGCAVAGSAAPNAGTPAQWLEIVRRETREEKLSESPARRLLLEGAAVALHPYNGRPALLAKRIGKDKRCTALHSWWQAEGEALSDKWLRGQPLSAEERSDIFLLHGLCFARYKHEVRPKVRRKKKLTHEEQDLRRIVERVDRRGKEALRKGYLEGRLTPGEIEDLRLYAMLVDNRCTGGQVLPFHLGLVAPSPAWSGRRPKPGAIAPDFTLLRFEAALKRPDYSDLNPHDPTDILRPAILTEYLLLMQGYERDPRAKRTADSRRQAAGPYVRAKPVVIPEGQEEDYVRLSDFRGRKPVLFVLANATDAFTWHWRIAPMFEPLHQAYKGHIEFFFVHTTIHDTYMPVRDFFGPEPGRHDAVHDLTPAHRARCCKMFYMDRPQMTVDYLLDDMAQRTRNAYRDQGGGAYIVLVDLDGRVAYADYHQDIPPHWGPKAVSFHDEYVYIRMNHLASRLKSFVASGCRYEKKIETPYPKWRRPPTLEEATIAEVDAAKRTIGVARDVAGKRKVGRFTLTSHARILLDGRPAKLGYLTAGSAVRVVWRAPDRGEGPAEARLVDARRAGARGGQAPTIWLSGRVKRIDADARRLVVQRDRLDPAAMKGWRFWQAAGDKVTAYDPATKARLECVASWLRAGPADRTVRFAIDDAVELFLDGYAAGLSDLRTGDHVGVLFEAWQRGRETILPQQVRAQRVPPGRPRGASASP